MLGVGLDELGISLINIRSTGFENVAVLFHDDRIRKKCAIVTDLDESIIDISPVAGDSDTTASYRVRAKASQEVGALRRTRLEQFADGNKWISVFFAPHTLEVDFVAAGNAEMIVGLVGDVYTNAATVTKATTALGSGVLLSFGLRVLRMAEKMGKGWFAVLVANAVDPQTAIPRYILDALQFAHPTLNDEIWFNILSYRLKVIEASAVHPEALLSQYRTALTQFQAGALSLAEIKQRTSASFPDDRINDVFEIY